MPKFVKWLLAVLAAIVVLMIAGIVIATLVVDVNRYKPQIEEQMAKATGRPFTLGGDLKPSVFPWIGVSISDVHLGNPPEFKEKDMVGVDFFEVRVKLLPLLSGNIEMKRFVLKGARITIIKDPKGRLNFEGIGPTGEATPGKVEKNEPETAPKTSGELPIKDFLCKEFSITDGSLVWIDMASGVRKEVNQVNLILENISLDKAISLDFSAIADNHPVGLKGSVGPVGPVPGKSPVAIDLAISLAETIQMNLDGRVELEGQAPRFDMALNVQPFSAREVLAVLDQPLPLEPSDSGVLKKIALALELSGSTEAVSVENGVLTLDDTKMNFSARAKDFDKPDLTLKATLDKIDLDRYLPAPSEAEQTESPKSAQPDQQTAGAIDYAPLRKLVMDGRINIGNLKAKNTRMENIDIHVTAKNGIFRAAPINMDLYSGKIQVDGTFNVQGKTPKTAVDMNIANVQTGTLIKDFLNKNLIEGMLNAAITLNFNGDQPDRIRETLNGNGELKFNDGAIVGIDLANMVRNVKAAFGGQGTPEQKPRTDFSELLVPLNIKNGLASIDGSKLNSPLMRILASGDAHVAEETLNLRIDPKFVATLVGQGDTQTQRSGVTVPVLITGTFSKPKFAPDLKSMLSTSVPGKEKITQDLEKTKKKVTEDVQKKAQDLIKKLPF